MAARARTGARKRSGLADRHLHLARRLGFALDEEVNFAFRQLSQSAGTFTVNNPQPRRVVWDPVEDSNPRRQHAAPTEVGAGRHHTSW